ncbi:MAG: hypothetical protein OEU26_01405 [Candidatus Tectomicrobia bacterium]|nr:hypothetical protein [Candidatus Tectomicrobia bacterium]
MMNNPGSNDADAPKDPDVQRWFEALGEPPTAHEPPGARVRMLAQINHRRERRWSLSWLSAMATPALATGLAAGLLLSVGLNVWWGRHIFKEASQGIHQVATTRPEQLDTPSVLSTYRFQASMQQHAELGPLVAARPIDNTVNTVVGFTPQADHAAYFRVGIYYADALAALHSEAATIGGQRLEFLDQALTRVQAPAELSQHIRKVQRLLRQQPNEAPTLTTFLAAFEPLYLEAYERQASQAAWPLFQVGAWLENLYLAVLTRDRMALQQTHRIEYYQHLLTQLSAPPEVRHELARIGHLVVKETLTDDDIGAIRTHVRNMQATLSE